MSDAAGESAAKCEANGRRLSRSVDDGNGFAGKLPAKGLDRTNDFPQTIHGEPRICGPVCRAALPNPLQSKMP